MMRQSRLFKYGEFENLQVLEMPYQSQQVEWQPVKIGNRELIQPVQIPTAEAISCSVFCSQKQSMVWVRWKLIYLRLTCKSGCRFGTSRLKFEFPDFASRLSFQLSESLRTMGMERAFSLGSADFSKMSDDPKGLYVGAVVHKAFIDVNETGTEAAAATGIIMLGGCAVRTEPPKKFLADHPFLFLIQDRKTRLIHFMGRLTNPM